MTAASLDELRLELAPALASAAVWDGWSEAAVRAAAQDCGIDPDAALYAFKDGAMAMIAAWIASVDAAMEADLPPERLGAMKIRERIRALV
ncbi:MAG TPA: COQ9 family protein, partial [Novosphingobium sp.]|nr:COQ9 family protein [Novosphingobium sp.]